MNRDQEQSYGKPARKMANDFVIVPESVSRRRIEVLPPEPSEDARHLLGTIDLPVAPSWDAPRDYLPVPESDWIIDVRFSGDQSDDSSSNVKVREE